MAEQMKADREATEAKKFMDPRSYCAKDGREILYGKDWTRRKMELWIRADGRCEKFIDGPDFIIGERCRSEGHDPHHKIRRSKQRDDRLNNLTLLCRLHHDLADERKIRSDRAERRKAVK